MTDREKLEKIKSLADKMYTSMQNLTSDTTPIRKAMDEYHQFIINEYHKEEPTIPEIVDEHFYEMLGEDPVSAEVWISADDDVNNAAEKTTRRFCKISLLSGDYLSLAEAQPQVNKESKLIAIKSFVCGAQWDRNKLMKEAVTAEVRMVEDFMGTTTFRCICDKYKIGDKVKLIILKEE